MGTKGCPETLVRNYHNTLCNSSEERSSQDRQCTCKIKTRIVHVATVAVKNNITYSECVCGLVFQHAKRIRLTISTTVDCPALPYSFPHYLINGTIFEKKKFFEYKWAG